MDISLIISILSFLGLGGAFITATKNLSIRVKAQQKGIQALLRAQLIGDYNKWSERGYAPIYARENFENCYKNYHALGENGVMDDIRRKFMELPTGEPITISYEGDDLK